MGSEKGWLLEISGIKMSGNTWTSTNGTQKVMSDIFRFQIVWNLEVTLYNNLQMNAVYRVIAFIIKKKEKKKILKTYVQNGSMNENL